MEADRNINGSYPRAYIEKEKVLSLIAVSVGKKFLSAGKNCYLSEEENDAFIINAS